MKKKIGLSIMVLVILGIIGTGMYFLERYKKSDEGLTQSYYKEIVDTYTLEENTNLIKMVKSDLDGDSIEEYIGIVGTPQYSEKENKLEDFVKNIDLYNNVYLVIINGSTKEIITFKSEKTFYKEARLSVNEDKAGKYIFVSDDNSGNIILAKLKDNNIVNIIKDSVQSDFNGYTINVDFDSANTSKIKVKLDNYARSYLNTVDDEFTLEFDDKRINDENYRATYIANKFCGFNMVDTDGDGLLELVGIQNILYLNVNDKKTVKGFPNTAGSVNTIFKIEEDKLMYDKVEVKK